MQIQCPVCGETGETDETLVIGQHIICPYCQSKFSYGDEDSTDSGRREIVANIAEPVEQIDARDKQVRHDAKKKMGEKKVCKECGNELHPKAVICPKCGCACSMQLQQKPLDENQSGAETTSKTALETIRLTIIIIIMALVILFAFFVFWISAPNEPSNSELERGVKEEFLRHTRAYKAEFSAEVQKTGFREWEIHFTVEYYGVRKNYTARAEMDKKGEIHYYMPLFSYTW